MEGRTGGRARRRQARLSKYKRFKRSNNTEIEGRTRRVGQKIAGWRKGSTRGADAFDGRGCTDIRWLIDIIQDIRVIGLYRPVIRSCPLISSASCQCSMTARSIHFTLCDAHAAVFAPGDARKIAARVGLLFSNRFAYARVDMLRDLIFFIPFSLCCAAKLAPWREQYLIHT